MKKIRIIKADPYNGRCRKAVFQGLPADVYRQRMRIFIERMESDGLTHTVIYGDREHFANIEYLCGFDPRFEEGMLIVRNSGELYILAGNEGMAYTGVIPLETRKILYQNFSLQGQPRDGLKDLREILAECGINKQAKVGAVGYKYHERGASVRNMKGLDIPYYIIRDLTDAAGEHNVINYTYVMTNLEDGIRNVIRDASEIAAYEYIGNKASNCVIDILRSLKPGISELEASANAGYDAAPISMFPIVNFGEEHVRLGLRSPDDTKLKEGDVITVCYGLRGSLVARSGIAAYDAGGLRNGMEGAVEDFYMPYYRAIADWYEAFTAGVSGGLIYDKVMAHIGDPERFGVALNPGHYIGGDEWVNSPIYKGSDRELPESCSMQCDMIASAGAPLRQAIVEDGAILAGEGLRAQLEAVYPEVYERMRQRRLFMKEILKISVSDDFLPVSNAQAVLHPYMLDTGTIFAIDRQSA